MKKKTKSSILFMMDKPNMSCLEPLYTHLSEEYHVTLIYDKKPEIKKNNDVEIVELDGKGKVSNRTLRGRNNNVQKYKINFFKKLIFSLMHYLRLQVKYIKFKKKISSNNNIEAIFVYSDRPEIDYTAVALKWAKKNKVKVIVPYTSKISDCITIRENKLAYKIYEDCVLDKILFRLRPDLINGTLKFYQTEKAIALYLFGVLPFNPWVLGGGISDIVCLDSMKTYKEMNEDKRIQGKFKIVGDVNLINLYSSYKDREQIKRTIKNKYNLVNEKIIIISLPQYYEHNLLDEKSHYIEIERWMGAASSLSKNILLSLHPKMKYKYYRYLEEKYNASILDERLSDVLPIADLFMAINSSTVYWAILCGVKTLLMNTVKLNIGDFNIFNSVVIVNKKDEMEDKLKIISTQDLDFENDWEKLERRSIFNSEILNNYKRLL